MLPKVFGLIFAMAFNCIDITSQIANPQPELLSAHATAYCVTGTMASGQYTRPGVCAGKRDWLGKQILIFQKLPGGEIGEFIGSYECLDTGGTQGLNNGTVVDIWCPDLDSCQEFMDSVYENGCQGRVYIQVLEVDG